jgi:hypothetical protein
MRKQLTDTEVKAVSELKCRMNAQIFWLAERLSEARILVGHDKCSLCKRFSFEACRKCWYDASLVAAKMEMARIRKG